MAEPTAQPVPVAEPLTVMQVANHCRHDTPRVPFELIMQRCAGSYEDRAIRWLGPDHSGCVPGTVLCVGGRPIYCSDVHPSEAQYAEIVAFITTTRLPPACDASGRSAAGLLWGAPVAFSSAEAMNVFYAQGRHAVEAFYSELVQYHRTGKAPATWPHRAL